MKSVIEREYQTSVRGFTFLSLSSKANQIDNTLFASNTQYLCQDIYIKGFILYPSNIHI